MKKKIFLTYIINAVISALYILKGTGTIISAKLHSNKSGTLQKITSSEFFNADFTKIVQFLEKALDTAQNVINAVNLYVYGYPSLFVGLFALMLSSIGVFFLTRKQTETTIGYYVTVVYSFVLLGLLTIVYMLISGAIAGLKK